ncbi:uncharacterized protein LOC117913267 [Vitis riparia]|uniref:uncharacterized protein LOC117913267 n=1 Tax=Vitis riparia TaxID=96939 RepID=UPI00155A4994|nr:uncharacterized protein LOC117913267 [Vitis riparia]
MDTRGKTNAEFRNEVNEALARHESSFDQVNATLQAVLTELQALRLKPKFSASFHLEGIALQWHRWLTKFREPLSWNDFTKAVLLRFGPTEYEDPSEALSRLKQTTTVAAYQEAFEGLSHQVDGLPEPFLIGCFIAGLRDDIRLDVKIKQPRTLASAIGVARLIEERNLLQKKIATPSRIPMTATLQKGPNPSAGILGPNPTQWSNNSLNHSSLPVRRITNQEARERREKGLCYYCDEKYFQGHRYERPQLFMITDTPPEEEEALGDNQQGTKGINTLPEISFHVITRSEHPQTLRVLGRLKNKDLTVLIDGGSTHNFIYQTVVSRFGLPVVREKKLQVIVANQERIECMGQCPGLMLTIQGIPVTTDYYILPVAACQVVLGVQWLETLSPIESDYKALTMSFKLGGTKHTLHGVRRTAGIFNIEALDDRECTNIWGTGFFFQIIPAHNQSPSLRQSPEMVELLNQYARVFEKPNNLPSKRPHDHRIPLQPNTEPVSVRPYRYPHYQKAEIERMVAELLRSGLIRPNMSPFSSPVLLVKKADGSWRFCVNYRAVNHITIKDKYPIPVIDELLDELHGAKFFSKLDLRSEYHQIRMQAEDILKTAFRTHEGHYESLVMPFRLTNAPATFQSLMNDLFRSYLRKFIIVFFDDILVYSKSWNDHLSHLQIVFDILSINQLFFKESKCQFGVTQVTYLGHIISEKGVSVDPDKIQAVVTWPKPTIAREVRGFLG